MAKKPFVHTNRKQQRKDKQIAEGYTYGHGYKLVGELSMSELQTNPEFSEHRRLRVFANKGTVCASGCGAVGTKFLLCQGFHGSLHYDIYTADNELMTIDHVLSQAKGGSNDLDNLVPMCSRCNGIKARTVDMEGLAEYRDQLAATGNNSLGQALP